MLGDYSVAIGRLYRTNPNAIRFFGSGVLVCRGNRFGVLTAYHCVEDLKDGTFEGEKLVLNLKRYETIIIEPQAIARHILAVPNTKKLQPDLAFVEILSPILLSSIRASSSFWHLNKKPRVLQTNFGYIGAPFVVTGYPGVYHKAEREENIIRKQIKHMTYLYAIRPRSILQDDGWDYIEANNWYGPNNDLPKTFAGVSGGPIWGLQVTMSKRTRQLRLERFALIGIAFLQIPFRKTTLRVRGHFIKSIYTRAWENWN
jgi:hypothetical protein